MDVPEPGWFNELAAFLGSADLRNAFTKGPEQEVGFLVDALQLEPGMRLLDAGCGPGRHALAFAERGLDVVGVDLSPEFVELARAAANERALTNARFETGDIRALAFDAEFDAVICLCQGGFGLLGGGAGEQAALECLARAVKPGGRVCVSAFNAYFVTKHLEAGDTFDPATGVNHERATLRDADGEEREFDLWTTCFTPRELQLLGTAAGLTVDAIYGVTPGAYAAQPPSLDLAEHLLVAHRPSL
jgi:SAM-dependent methyltransferase